MNRDSATRDEAADSPELLRQSRRDHWAFTLAAIVTTIHGFAGSFVFGWYYFTYYFIVPRLKQELDGVGHAISRPAILLIIQSDFLVNYWYLLLFVGPLALLFDFVVTRWIGKQIGLRWAICFGFCMTAVLLITVAWGQYLLHQELG